MEDIIIGDIAGGGKIDSYVFWFCQDFLRWGLLAAAAQVIFALRFIGQWIASERRKESVVPPAFWYFSFAGGLMLSVYALVRDPVVLVSAAPSIVIYARNIILNSRIEAKRMLQATLAAAMAGLAYAMIHFNALASWYLSQAAAFWSESGDRAWIVFGFAAQTIFFMRFIWQWIVSERRKESVIPVGFWYFSLAGGLMLSVYYAVCDPMLVPGTASGVVVYVRNLMLIQRKKQTQHGVPSSPLEDDLDPSSPREAA